MLKVILAAVFMLTAVPAYADAPPMSPTQPKISVERQCYYAVEQEWNNAIATMADVPRFSAIYGHFAKCAELAISARAWPEYFADTMGAMYSQIQMAGLTSGNVKCGHYATAKDLGQQALQVEQSTNEQGDPEFEGAISELLGALRDGAIDCGGTHVR